MNARICESTLIADDGRLDRDAAEPVLRARNVSVNFGAFDLCVPSLDIGRNTCTAIVGHNGAGKSTLIETILCLNGARVEGTLFGVEMHAFCADSARRRSIGIQLSNVAYPGSIEVNDLVRLHDRLYRRDGASAREILGIDALRRKRYYQLSTGEKRRVDLYMAIAHSPRLLILDEPCSGLDRRTAMQFLELLEMQRETTILLICHTADELLVTEDVIWMSHGRVLRHAARADLQRELVGERRLQVETSASSRMRELGQLVRDTQSGARIVERAEHSLTVYGGIELQGIARRLIDLDGVVSCTFAASTPADLLAELSSEGHA